MGFELSDCATRWQATTTGGARDNKDHREVRKLTLDAWEGSAEMEAVGIDGELARGASDGAGEELEFPAMYCVPSRFLRRGWSGGRGGGSGALRFAPGALNQRRRARRPWLGFGARVEK